MKTPASASTLKRRREERRALERAILRTVRNEYLGRVPGVLSPECQATLYGLERARREVK